MNDYAVDAYVADEELEEKLNVRDREGYIVWKLFRNEPSRGGTENTTIIWKHVSRVIADKESTYPLEKDAAPLPSVIERWPAPPQGKQTYNDQW